MKTISILSMVFLVWVATACKSSSSSSSATTSTTSGGTSGNTGGTAGNTGGTSGNAGTPTPTPIGMNCSQTGAGADILSSGSVFFVDNLAGSTITSIGLYPYYNDNSSGQAMSGATTYSVNMTITAYTCGSSNSLGSQVGTATYVGSMNGVDSLKTFTFSSPIAIPAAGACASGQHPLVFKYTTSSGLSGFTVYADSVLISSSCNLDESSTTSGAVAAYRAWNAVITATP